MQTKTGAPLTNDRSKQVHVTQHIERILGIDSFGAGATRRRKTQYGRLTKILKRMPKVTFSRAEWSTRHAVRGHATNKRQENDWAIGRGALAHVAAFHARARPDSHVRVPAQPDTHWETSGLVARARERRCTQSKVGSH